jgi:hypothetical protein
MEEHKILQITAEAAARWRDSEEARDELRRVAGIVASRHGRPVDLVEQGTVEVLATVDPDPGYRESEQRRHRSNPPRSRPARRRRPRGEA